MTDSSGTVPIARRAVHAAYYAFVLWIPIETVFVIKSDGTSPVTITQMLGLVLFGLALFARRSSFGRFPAAFWMVAWYLALFSLSQLWVPSELYSIFVSEQLTLAQMVLLFLISVNLFTDVAFRDNLMRFYGRWMVLVAAGTLLGIFGGQFGGLEGRNSILEQDPNVAAGFFALGAACVAGDPRLFAGRRMLPRIILSVAAIGLLILAILRTGSRGGLVVFVVAMIGLILCGTRTNRKRRFTTGVAVAALFAGMIFVQFQKGTIAAQRLDLAVQNGDTAGRTDIWKVALSMVIERPLLGFGGANNFSTLGGHLRFVDADTHNFSRDTHNLYLAVLTEVGLIGAVPFFAALLLALWTSWSYGDRTGNGLPFALMCALITINVSLTGYHQKLFWIFFAAAVACGLGTGAAGKSGRTPARARP